MVVLVVVVDYYWQNVQLYYVGLSVYGPPEPSPSYFSPSNVFCVLFGFSVCHYVVLSVIIQRWTVFFSHFFYCWSAVCLFANKQKMSDNFLFDGLGEISLETTFCLETNSNCWSSLYCVLLVLYRKWLLLVCWSVWVLIGDHRPPFFNVRARSAFSLHTAYFKIHQKIISVSVEQICYKMKLYFVFCYKPNK